MCKTKQDPFCTLHKSQLRIKDLDVIPESTKLTEQMTEVRLYGVACSVIIWGMTPKPLRTKPKGKLANPHQTKMFPYTGV